MVKVLIRARRKTVDHKFEDKVEENEGYCYWTGIHPRKATKGDIVMFTDGTTVFGEGVIVEVDRWDGLVFTPLVRVNYPQPKKAPTRGFTYVGD